MIGLILRPTNANPCQTRRRRFFPCPPFAMTILLSMVVLVAIPPRRAMPLKAEVKSGHLASAVMGLCGFMASPGTVIQAPKLEPRTMRYELTDQEWAAIKPMLPNKPHGVPRVNDRRVLADCHAHLKG